MSGMHTPGPWMVVPYGDGDSLVICSDEGGDWRICFMATPGGTSAVWQAIQANARLIAAAPELLDDGQFLVDRLDEFERELLDDEVASQFFGHVSPAIARFRAAIAKAQPPAAQSSQEVMS